jgi:hypothetical protein
MSRIYLSVLARDRYGPRCQGVGRQSARRRTHGRRRTAAVAAGRSASTYPLCAVNSPLGETRNHWTNRVRACFADSALRRKSTDQLLTRRELRLRPSTPRTADPSKNY